MVVDIAEIEQLVVKLRELEVVTAPRATSANPEYQEGLSNAYAACADRLEKVVAKVKRRRR